MPRLSPEARNTIAIENDEMCHGLDASLMLKDHVALVLDIHHHWIRDEEYIQADDDRVKMVIDSWRGCLGLLYIIVIAGMNGSTSQAELMKHPRHHTLHSIPELLETGAKKQKT